MLNAGAASSAKLDEARFTLERIDAVGPREGEYEELSARLARAEHAEALALAANRAHEALGGDEGAIDLLNSAIAALGRGRALRCGFVGAGGFFARGGVRA
ncbi:MAG: hypothetical protein V8T51_04705 [Senegalimassilia faecalis]